MHRLHSALTVAVPIKDGKSAELRVLLKHLQPPKPVSRKTITQASGDRSWNSQEISDSSLLSDHTSMENNTVIRDPTIGERDSPVNGSPWEDTTGNLAERSPVEFPTRTMLPLDSSGQLIQTIAIETKNPAFFGSLAEDKSIPEVLINDVNQTLNFDICETILFVTGVIIPAQYYGKELLPATLVFATTYVGTLDNHLEDLIKSNRDGLCAVFRHCVHFPEGRYIGNREIINYLKHHKQRSAFNSRYSGLTKQDVKREKDLRKEIEDYLDKANEYIFLNGQHPKTVKKLIERHIKAQGDKFRWAQKPGRNSVYETLTKKRLIILPTLLALVILLATFYTSSDYMTWPFKIILGVGYILIIILPALILLFTILILISKQKNKTAERPSDDYVRTVAATQLRPIINEMTAAAPLKKGWLRRHFYSLALRFVNLGCHHFMVIPTVSSIRWLSVDNKKRLLFLSNYSNTTDFYVREFLTGKTPLGVNFMFTNGTGFPDARLLRFGGIKEDPEGYMNVIHKYQHGGALWYSHEYDLTIDQILRNRKLRNGLFRKMNKQNTVNWLQML
ncbi:MAG: hypothetical protein EOP48_05645 [Sphingobacteriales bacterium]|nr:MAG: hypothetical protein EOP48_05645 [Sphingobacteriales bacterium]